SPAAGLVLEIRKRGGRTSFVLDDRSGRMEITLFEETWQQYRDIVVKDALLLVDGNLRFDEFSDAWRIAAKRLQPLESVREQQARRLVLTLPPIGRLPADWPDRLARILEPCRPGACEVLVRVQRPGERAIVALGKEWAIRPTPRAMEQLEALVGFNGLQVVYDVPTSGGGAAAAPHG
ncbi:MAG: hypothetical protein EOP08_12400, partial [Proteobacteria bacterium]